MATRIDPTLAQQIAEQANQLGLSFAKMLALIISKGCSGVPPTNLADEERQAIASHYKQAIGRFISRMAQNQAEQNELMQIFNECYSEE